MCQANMFRKEDILLGCDKIEIIEGFVVGKQHDFAVQFCGFVDIAP
jgi:hypothetical protein